MQIGDRVASKYDGDRGTVVGTTDENGFEEIRVKMDATGKIEPYAEDSLFRLEISDTDDVAKIPKKPTDKKVSVKYSENNSGGDWWLTEADYRKLYEHGWVPEPDYGYSRSGNTNFKRPHGISKAFYSEALGIAEWEYLTGQNADYEGCSCCGQPHNFYTSEIK